MNYNDSLNNQNSKYNSNEIKNQNKSNKSLNSII
jgi:hypothetical protein